MSNTSSASITFPTQAGLKIYRDDAIGVYENREAYPRAWIVPQARGRRGCRTALADQRSAPSGLCRGNDPALKMR